MYKGHKIGVVVPAYNEEKLIEKTLSGIPDYVDRIYVIDDASTDNTSQVVQKIMKKDTRVTLIKHETNKGVGGAIITGYKKGIEEGMDILVVMAGDNQMEPKDLPALLDPIIERDIDFTKGNRFLRKDYELRMPLWRRFGTFLLDWLTKIASGYWHISDPQNGYVAISTKALKRIDLESLYQGYAFENDLLIKASLAGLKAINVPVRIRYKVGESSKLRYGKFIVNTSWFLLTSFLNRIWIQYIQNFKAIGFLYLTGFLLIIASIPSSLVISNSILMCIAGLALFISACILEAKNNTLSDSPVSTITTHGGEAK
ncbi:glycosyltransferase family 2 protein [Thermococcus sp. 18S1]|nr:glycosyltransferase family 2 protein [Thermococcus sp. 18S1]